MDAILRGIATYAFVWAVFRLAGKRSLAQITTFDAVLLLIISEATQAALLDKDDSITNSFLLIITILGMDVLLSEVKRWVPSLEKWIDGVPCVLVDRGAEQTEALQQERVSREDILSAARENLGLANMDEVEYAILEQHGGISIVPKREATE